MFTFVGAGVVVLFSSGFCPAVPSVEKTYVVDVGVGCYECCEKIEGEKEGKFEVK